MLVSHSPPVFSHSPPGGFLSQNYSPLQDPSFLKNSIPKLQRHNSFPLKNNTRRLVLPKRSILVVRTSEDPLFEDESSTTSKTKKRVVFADDHGMSLTQIRTMTEPSNVPPLWTKRFLAEVTQGISADPIISRSDWEIAFPQPASDYVKFRQKLEITRVSLENIIIKENKDQLVGTVKVANLSYEKQVTIRYSTDNWESHTDYLCAYASNTCSASSYVIYDTFTFNVDLPKKSRRFEFCICYKCNETDYWDNNDNRNYLITKKVQFLPSSGTCDGFLKVEKPQFEESARIKIDTYWSEFASWTHLENSSPYW